MAYTVLSEYQMIINSNIAITPGHKQCLRIRGGNSGLLDQDKWPIHGNKHRRTAGHRAQNIPAQ